MSWPDVEFLDPAGIPLLDDPVPPAPEDCGTRRVSTAPALAVLGWIAAGALAVRASFALAYSASVNSSRTPAVTFSVDGWGRERLARDSSTFGAHATRLGVVFVAAAAILLVLVLLAVWRFWRGGRTHVRPGPVMTSFAVAVPCLLATAAAAQWLIIDGVQSAYRAINRQNAALATSASDSTGTSQSAADSAIHTQIGSSLWLAIAATTCAAAATALYVWPLRSAGSPAAGADVATVLIGTAPEDDVCLGDAELLA